MSWHFRPDKGAAYYQDGSQTLDFGRRGDLQLSFSVRKVRAEERRGEKRRAEESGALSTNVEFKGVDVVA